MCFLFVVCLLRENTHNFEELDERESLLIELQLGQLNDPTK